MPKLVMDDHWHNFDLRHALVICPKASFDDAEEPDND
jgi:hypothetical protein